ncbi:hypothetical protein J1N35_033254 [Gossypium stocksii]|uniref:DUF4283 domain-containing protein n=1 Tax=Gossypium stocksii TaxID=47602 RepID=A0A9D3URP0_9ROSI|nr:hypothetical protein J1N35_033254 [Gossypium stocksii]
MVFKRLLKGSPWTFSNHLLILNRLKKDEDPLNVPLIFAYFWVQIHEVPLGFYIATLARQIRGFLENFLEFNDANLGKGEMGWDLSLRAQSRRALAISSMWLREDKEEVKRGSILVDQYLGRRIDPILGVNLEGDLNLVSCLDGGS